jgi:ABC-type glucose/galactose transport system permease subunit
MTKFLARARVVATSAVTWLQVVAAVLVIAAEEIAKAVPEVSDDVTTVVVRIVAVLGAAVAIIRRVTPALPDERGLLPAGGTPGDA